MRRFVALTLALFTLILAFAIANGADNYVCEGGPEIVGPCFEVHGRLSYWNGTPSARIWPIGSSRLLGIKSDILPPELQEKMKSFDSEAYADFYVCPYTDSKPGHMRFICIQSWKNLVIRQRKP